MGVIPSSRWAGSPRGHPRSPAGSLKAKDAFKPLARLVGAEAELATAYGNQSYTAIDSARRWCENRSIFEPNVHLVKRQNGCHSRFFYSLRGKGLWASRPFCGPFFSHQTCTFVP